MQCCIDFSEFADAEYTEAMQKYLIQFHEPDLRGILEDPNPSVAKHHSVAVSFLELSNNHQVLSHLVAHYPQKAIPLFDAAVVEAQRELADATRDEYAEYSVKESCHLRVHRLPRCPELWKPTVTSIRACDINRLLSVSGTVIRTGIMKLIHQRREYRCTKCDHRFFCHSDFEQRNEMMMPPECPSAGLSARPCGAGPNKFEAIPGSETCRDYQEVRIQEQVHRLTVGSIPRAITLVLQDDLVDRCKPGDDVTIVGVLRKRWRPLTKDQRPDIELAITAEHVRVRNEERGADHISGELAAEFADFWQRLGATPLAARDHLIQQTCPSLAGMYLVKLATLLTLLGGVSHTDRHGMKVRGESHMLLVGDAGTGKSQVLRHAARLSPRSVLTTGIGSTAAGLTCTAVKDASGEWMLEAGALVLADGGVCCVDEFDSIKSEERTAVLEAMEQQTISVAKAGMVCKLRTKCTVFAATNPKGGKMDRGIALHSQTGLATPLISRFDIVLLLSDSQDPVRDQRLASHILDGATGTGWSAAAAFGDPAAASQVPPPGAGLGVSQAPGSVNAATAAEASWTLEKLRSYLEFVRARTTRPGGTVGPT